jgi:hypothetical protein
MKKMFGLLLFSVLLSTSFAEDVDKKEVKVEEQKVEVVKEEVKAEEPKTEAVKEEVKAEEPKAEIAKEEVMAEESKPIDTTKSDDAIAKEAVSATAKPVKKAGGAGGLAIGVSFLDMSDVKSFLTNVRDQADSRGIPNPGYIDAINDLISDRQPLFTNMFMGYYQTAGGLRLGGAAKMSYGFWAVYDTVQNFEVTCRFGYANTFWGGMIGYSLGKGKHHFNASGVIGGGVQALAMDRLSEFVGNIDDNGTIYYKYIDDSYQSFFGGDIELSYIFSFAKIFHMGIDGGASFQTSTDKYNEGIGSFTTVHPSIMARFIWGSKS